MGGWVGGWMAGMRVCVCVCVCFSTDRVRHRNILRRRCQQPGPPVGVASERHLTDSRTATRLASYAVEPWPGQDSEQPDTMSLMLCCFCRLELGAVDYVSSANPLQILGVRWRA